MSGTSGTQASTKGETTSSKSSKSGYDHLDINKLYKGKSTEPVAKTVTQKHGMQTLGKAPPARRGGNVVKTENTSSDVANSSASKQPTSLPPNIGQTAIHPPGWSNSSLSHPPGPPSPHNAPSVPTTGPAMHDKNWSGGPDRKGNFPSAAAHDKMQRFAQEFPSLDSGGDSGKGPTASAGGQTSGPGGHPQMSKSNQDNQYGPGPILRPQTEGSWTQGGGRGMARPPGPPPPSGASTREFGPERPNLGGPTPPPMSVGQGGHPPPPIGAFPMQFPPRAPYMYPNSGPPPGPGGFYPPGPGMPRYGMPMLPGAPPPPSSHPPDGSREPQRGGRGPPPPRDLRPVSHFISKPIIKQEELLRMDELGAQDGGWATVQDDIDYNKKISFSDDEGEDKGKENSSRGGQSKSDRVAQRQDLDKREDERELRRPVKILERQQPPSMNDRNDRDRVDQRDRDSRYESKRETQSGRYDYENEDDWKRKPAPGFEQKERERDRGRGRVFREEDSWRSADNSRFEEDPRAQRDSRDKKGPVVPPTNVRVDPRGGPQQFQSNLPPRLQRQHQQPPTFSMSSNQRKTPSPTSGSGNAVNKDRDFRDRDRPAYKILERNRGDSESSKDSSSRDVRDRRYGNNDCDIVPVRLRDKEPNKRLSSDSGKLKDEDETKMSPKDKSDVESGDNDAKASFRSKPPSALTSSWADEVADEEYNSRDDDDARKGGFRDNISSHLKRDQVYPDERRPRENTREVPRRVIIQQTKVENMRSDVVKPEPVVEAKPEPVKPEKPVVEKVKSSAWGDRDVIREKSKTENDQAHKDASSSKENDRETHSSERESSHRSQKSDSSGPTDSKPDTAKENDNDKSHHMDGKGSREKLDRDRHYDRYGGGGGRYDDRRQDNKDSNRTDSRNNSVRDNRPKPRRMDSYETKRDNRTPDRDQYGGGNRNSNADAGNSTSRNSQEKEEKNKPNIEKSKSGERLDSMKDKGLDRNEKDEFRRDRDMDREKDYERHNRNERDDYDSPRDRGHRGGRGKERGGYGIYQPRGGSHSWGNDRDRDRDREAKGRNRGRGNSRDFYDSKPRRMDSEKDEKSFRKEEDGSRQNLDSDAKDKLYDKSSEVSNKGSVEDLGSKKKDKDSSGSQAGSNAEKKGNKSPGTARRNARGGARLQGYGPPSDKTPFSSSQSHKDDESREKSSESQANSKPAPVPLMALGDISPPNMQSKSRHHGGVGGRDVGGRGRGVPPPRMQREDYSFRGGAGGGSGNKRGGRTGDAKPLMSINSNEVEGNEWESGSESGDDESKRSRKEGATNKSGSDKFRQSQNVNRNGSAKASSNTFNHTQDSANNNKGKGGGTSDTARGSTSNFEIDCYSGHQTNPDLSQHGNTSDNLETVDNESGGFQKKNAGQAKQPMDKTSMNSGQKNIRPDPKPTKDRRIKNPPYDPRPTSKQQGQSSVNNSNSGWEKSNVPSSQSKDNLSQPSTQSSNSTPTVESKDIPDTKPQNATTIHPASAVSNPSMLDNTGPLKTMIFENTNFKSINSNTTKVSKPLEMKKEAGLPSSMDLGKDLQLGFGKVVGDENPEIDFGTFNDPAASAPTGVPQQNHGSVSNQAPSSKSMPIGQPTRSFVSHQPSPISPQAADLNEKVQSVKRIWEMPTMPSVAEQNSVCGSDDNSFHGGFGADSFKGSDTSSREFTSSLQQPTSGYAPGSSPALSAISKPDSSSSPTSSNLRISKPQQNSLDNQGQSGISSSPFGGYTMPQPQGSNAFSGMPAVPSPPSVMYGTSQTLHAGVPPSGMYQTFPHVDAPQVMGATARTQYQQYPSQAATSGHYGLFLQTPMDYQSMSSYQHQQGSQGPPGQAPSQSSRISPGPMTTTGGGNSGVIISSTNSMMNMKPQSGSGSHPSMQHQVVPGSQQGYSQLSHHHPGAGLSHPQHHLGAVGPSKGGYSQSGMGTPSQTPVFIPFDPQQSVINLGQNFLSSSMRSGPPGGPPPPATPPVQALQASSTYYSGSSGNQNAVYPQSNQGQSLQQLHVAVAQNHQGLPGMHSGNPQYGLGYPTQLNLQNYNTQAAASTVSALNLSSQLIRNAGPSSHSYMKQPGMDLVQQSQLKSSHDPSMMGQNTWNSPGFSLNQSFHGGNKTGNNQDRNPGNNIGNQRKGNNHPGNVGNMKYMSSQGPGGYTGQVPQ